MYGRLSLSPAVRVVHRGFILAVAMALLFVMVALDLGLAQQSRALQGFSQLVEREALAAEAAEVGFAGLAAIFQGEMPGATMGLPDPIPGPGGAIAALHEPAGVSMSLAATFNSGSQSESLFRADPGPTGFAAADGFEDFVVTAGGFRVPARHASVQMSAEIPGQVRATWLSVYSSNFEWGMLAPNGSISLLDGRASANVNGADADESGHPVHISGAGDVSVTEALNGRARSAGGTVSVGLGGVAQTGLAAVPFPADFLASLAAARDRAKSGLTSQGGLLGSLPTFDASRIPADNSVTYTCPDGGTVVLQSNPGSFRPRGRSGGAGGSSPSNEYSVGVPLVVSSGQSWVVPGDLTCNSDLVLQDHTVLHVQGNLDVSGHIYLDALSTLVVDDAVSVGGSVVLTYLPAASKAITSVIIAGGDVSVDTGTVMAAPGMVVTMGVDLAHSGCPFQSSTLTCEVASGSGTVLTQHVVANPHCKTFEDEAKAWMRRLPESANTILGTVTPGGPNVYENVPGVMIWTDGSLHIGGDKAVGLFVAGGDIDVTSPRLVGAAWSRSGSIAAPNTRWRFYPYWTHAFVHTASGDVQVAARTWHRTAFGKMGSP